MHRHLTNADLGGGPKEVGFARALALALADTKQPTGMTASSQITASIPARDGTCGVLAVEFQGTFPIPNRDATGAGVRVRVLDRPRTSRAVVVFSDTYAHQFVAEQLGMPALAGQEFELECALSRIGDELDKRGWAMWAEGESGRVEIPCYSADFERWFNTPPAREADVIAYLSAKVYWAWRYDQPSAVIAAADLIRLRLPWNTIDRMAQLGDGLKWMRDPGSTFFVPEASALREYHDRITSDGSDQDSLAHQLSAPRYRGPYEHWAKVMNFMSAAGRDPANAAKEAICAVEGAARLVTGEHSATLGDLLKTLKGKHAINSAMVKSIEGLWGFTSNEPGVRHGAATSQTINYDQARYVVDSAEAALRFLLTLDS